MSAELNSALRIDEILQKGIALFENDAWQAALECFDEVVRSRPRSSEVHNRRARALERLGRLEEALECLDRALEIDPSNASDLRNRGIVLRKLGRLPEALASYDTALDLRPNDNDLVVKRALMLNELDRREEAFAVIDRAARRQPGDPETLNARVIILDNLGRYAEALEDLDRMLAVRPDHLDAINNTGMILARLGRFGDALTCYDRSLAIQPDQAQARYNRSLVRLAVGDWIRGFQEFESRWNTAPLNGARPTGLGQLWLGKEDLSRKTILLYHEQGYGDTLQCARYVPLLADRGARVILAVPAALRTIMQTLPGVTQVISGNEALPAHDYQSPLMSLPLAFRTTPDTVPAPTPYLRADPALVDRWAQHLGPRKRLRIGLSWGGRRYAPINYPRDIPLVSLRSLLALDANFISVQKEITAADRALLAQLPQIQRLGESLEDFADTAALIENLDLVIAVDTAVVHLAGALGKPVWLLNRHASCWRWLQGRTDSPWYPTLRQFHQVAAGDWVPVVTAVCTAVSVLLKSQTGSESRPVLDGGGADAGTPMGGLPISAGLQRVGPALVSVPRATAQLAPRQKMRFVCATRLSSEDFFKQAPLGRSLPVYRTFPKRQTIELRLFADNREGLSGLYNTAIEEVRLDPAILIFIHDDVYLSDYYWAEHLHAALRSFDVVGLAGNRRRVPRQASWMYLDDHFTSDNFDNLSGVLGHGDPFPNLRELSVYGEPGHEVKLLDGVLIAVRSQTLMEHGLRFDPRFRFHFYDLDFCRQCELRGVRMGTGALSVVHASAGKLGGESWHAAYRDYLAKYGET
jgi:tetratricopeptide (TPR) repeat protein